MSIDKLSMLVLTSAEKLRLPQRSIDVILVSLFLEMLGDDHFNLKQKDLSLISKSLAVEKEVIQCSAIKTTSASRIKCVEKAVLKFMLS